MKLWKVKLNQLNQPYGIIVSFSTAKVANAQQSHDPSVKDLVIKLCFKRSTP